MKTPRWKLRTMMLLVAALAVALASGLGLKRRSERYARLALYHSGVAGSLEERLVLGSQGPEQATATLERVHHHDALAARFRDAASRPWITVSE